MANLWHRHTRPSIASVQEVKMTPFNKDILILVRDKNKIGQSELIRQGYEYHNYRLTPEKLAEKQQNYFRFGVIEDPVREYCQLVLDERIKL